MQPRKESSKTPQVQPEHPNHDSTETLPLREAKVRPPSERLTGVPRLPAAAGRGLEVMGVLARGGSAQILDARQLSLGRDVAVKVALEAVGLGHEAVLLEARFLAQLSHPNIVPLYALDVDGAGRPRVQLKRLVGEPWARLLRSPGDQLPTDPEERLAYHLNILLAVCDAVAHAHRRGILHLDIKPANVVLGAFGEVYLVDFAGAASTKESLRGWVPLAKQIRRPAGTPAYMAPEQADDLSPPPTVQTDIFLLGGLLHCILTGRAPHHAVGAESSMALVLEGRALDLEGAPAALAASCRRAMARLPEHRFPHVESFRAEISGYLESRQAGTLMADADARRSELEALIDGGPTPGTSEDERTREMHRLFGASRFGYRAASEVFGGRQARERQTRVERLMAEHLLMVGAEHQARQVVGDMEPVPEDLVEALAVLVRRREADASKTQELLSLAADRDTRRSAKARARIFLAILVLVAVPIGAAGLGHGAGRFTLPTMCLPAFQGLAVLLVALGAAMARETIVSNQISRQLISAIALLTSASLASTIVLLATGASMETAAAVACVGYGIGTGVMGLFTDPKLYPVATALVVAGILGAAWPQWAVLFLGGALSTVLTRLVILRSREASTLGAT